MSEAEQRAALTRKLWLRINERGELPMLSDSLRATISAMKGDDYDYTALVQIILSDFTLTQRVIRLANSTMYLAFGGNITTVSRAVLVLGAEAVGHVVLGLKLVDHFQQFHSELHRLDAKLELNRAMLAGCVARKVCETSTPVIAEDAVICTLLRQLGKLLCIFYLEAEWVRIREWALTRECSQEQACKAVLGIKFEDLGEEAAERWGLPSVIRRGMESFDPGLAESEEEYDSAQWLKIVASFSLQMSHSMTVMGADVALRDQQMKHTARLYAEPLRMKEARLYELADALTKESASRRFIQDIDDLRVQAEQESQYEPDRVIRNGLRDLRSLPPQRHAGAALTIALEAMLAGMKFSRTLVFLRDPRHSVFEARLGFGNAIEQLLPRLQFKEVFSVDVFHLAITNSVGVFIENAHDPKFSVHIPEWFKQVMPDARAFVLLPVRVGKQAVALIYGDWNQAGTERKIDRVEMEALNDLARELPRFFANTSLNPIEVS